MFNMLSDFSLSWFHPFEKIPSGFTLIHWEIQFEWKRYFQLSFFLFGFGLSLWWWHSSVEEEYQPLETDPKVYQTMLELTKGGGSQIIPDDAGTLVGDYNQLYLYTHNNSYQLKPTVDK